MKNTYLYLLLMSLRVCLVIAGCLESKALQQVMLPTPSKVMLRLIRKQNTLCAPPLKLQAVH